MNYKIRIATSFTLLLLTFTGLEAASPIIKYKLGMSQPNTHYFEVEMQASGLKGKSIDAVIPVWAPGSYLVREFARHVEDFRVTGSGNRLLNSEKTTKNTWKINLEGQESIRIQYRVYAFELSVRTSFLDLSHAYLNGTSVFMYLEGYQQAPVELLIEPYSAWSKISTTLAMIDNNPWHRRANDYDILVDSPIEIGNHDEFSFTVAGIEHRVAMYGKASYDRSRISEDLAKIAEQSTRVFGVNPNQEYLFIVHNLDNRGGGLEHYNSTTLQVDRWTYQNNEDYLGFLSLAAHEYFHLWLVKRLRPISLGPFDYNRENYTRLLWVMEGFTSYYDELLLNRAGFISREQYLNKLASSISNLENQPGNRVQPVAMASFDAWIKYYRPDENSINSSVSYYSKGAILAAMLDLEIIHQSKGEKSLDDFLRYLYKTFYVQQNRGFTELEFQTALERFTGRKMDDFFANYVNGTQQIDYQQYFGYVGLNLINRMEGTEQPYLGLNTSEKGGKLMVNNVYSNGSAYTAGINPGDEIISAEGYRVDKLKLEQLVNYKKPGEVFKITIARDGVIQDVPVTLTADPRMAYHLVLQKNITGAQEKQLDNWLK